MSTQCARVTTLTYTGDLTATQTIEAAQNRASPGVIEHRSLPVGDTTVTVPNAASTPVAVTIVPPPGNTTAILLKALPGDTGLSLHVTDPTTLALAPTQASFVLTVTAAIAGLRLFWS